MDNGERRVLAERVVLERVRLEQVSRLLQSDAVVELIGEDVSTALRQLLAKQIAGIDAGADASGGQSWQRLARDVRDGDHILSECLAVIAGSVTRSMPAFSTLCAEARCVAAELSRLTLVANGFDIIPAATECAGIASSVVRRRFPDHGVWDLPVVAHEFGHLVARDLLDIDPASGDTSRPLAEFLAGRRVQAAELAADVFAVFSIGPAYVLSLALHRMDPTAPAVAGERATHPGDASRVHAALHTLGSLGASDKRAERREQYDFLIEEVGKWWSQAQASASSDARLSEVDAARVRSEADKIWKLLIGSRFVDVRYQSFFEARALADGLRDGRHPHSTSARDVLNAAWLARFRDWRDGNVVRSSTSEWARAELSAIAAAL